MTPVGLMGYVRSKRNHAAPARDLYESQLFQGRREAGGETCDCWYILSAGHGLVRPDDTLHPYNKTLVGALASRKRSWSARVLDQLDHELGPMEGVSARPPRGTPVDHGPLGARPADVATAFLTLVTQTEDGVLQEPGGTPALHT